MKALFTGFKFPEIQMWNCSSWLWLGYENLGLWPSDLCHLISEKQLWSHFIYSGQTLSLWLFGHNATWQVMMTSAGIKPQDSLSNKWSVSTAASSPNSWQLWWFYCINQNNKKYKHTFWLQDITWEQHCKAYKQ